MSNPSFTRDEVILLLDAMYSCKELRVNEKSEEIIKLSELLKRLPIHLDSVRCNSTFRSATGLAQQVRLFLQSCSKGEKSPHVGKLMFEVAFEYENQVELLHRIAESIRRNYKFYNINFGSVIEDHGFQEGILLGYLHHIIEKKALLSFHTDDKCSICNVVPSTIYSTSKNLLELHLIIPPEQLDGNAKYCKEKYITVCPMCHSALHHIRPWYSGGSIDRILR